jgi:hypothetical protein
MQTTEMARAESDAPGEFARLMRPGAAAQTAVSCVEGVAKPPRLKLDETKNGLGQLVLTLVKLLHELLERQAIRRIESGSLSEAEIERMGMTMMRQAEEIDRLRVQFGLKEEDLNLDLGPLGKLL